MSRGAMDLVKGMSAPVSRPLNRGKLPLSPESVSMARAGETGGVSSGAPKAVRSCWRCGRTSKVGNTSWLGGHHHVRQILVMACFVHASPAVGRPPFGIEDIRDVCAGTAASCEAPSSHRAFPLLIMGPAEAYPNFGSRPIGVHFRDTASRPGMFLPVPAR